MSKARELSQLGDKIDIDDTTGDFAVDTDTLYVDVSDSRVGIGLNTNISSALHVNSEASLGPDNNNRMILGSTSGGVGSIGTIEGGTASFNTMTFKGGKVGIGVTPYSHSGLGTFSTVNNLSLIGNGTSGAYVGYNVYYDSDWKYAESSAVGLLSLQNDGSLTFRQGASGTKDAAVSLSERMRIDSDGKVLVGKTSSSASTNVGIELHGTGSVFSTRSSGNTYYLHDTSAYKFYVNANGGIYNYQSNNVNLSDEREKKNIETLDDKWDAVKAWSLKKFHYNSEEDSDPKKIGVIAQDLETNHPELIAEYEKTEDETRKSVKEQQMMWMAIKALQEAMAKIETLETENTAIKARLDALEAG